MLKLNTRMPVTLKTTGFANPMIEAVGVIRPEIGDEQYEFTGWLQEHTPVGGFRHIHAALPATDVTSDFLESLSPFLIGTWTNGNTFVAYTQINNAPSRRSPAFNRAWIVEYPTGRRESHFDGHLVSSTNLDQEFTMFGYVEAPYLWIIQPQGVNVSNLFAANLTSSLAPTNAPTRTFTIEGGSLDLVAYERLGNLELHMPDMYTAVIRKLDAPTATRTINISGVTPYLWRSPNAFTSDGYTVDPIARICVAMDTSLGATIDKVRLIILTSSLEWVIYGDFEHSRVNVFNPPGLGIADKSIAASTQLIAQRFRYTTYASTLAEIAVAVPGMFRVVPDTNKVDPKSRLIAATLTERNITNRRDDALPPRIENTITLSEVPDGMFEDEAHRVFFEHEGYRYLVDDILQTEPLTWEATCTVEKM